MPMIYKCVQLPPVRPRVVPVWSSAFNEIVPWKCVLETELSKNSDLKNKRHLLHSYFSAPATILVTIPCPERTHTHTHADSGVIVDRMTTRVS